MLCWYAGSQPYDPVRIQDQDGFDGTKSKQVLVLDDDDELYCLLKTLASVFFSYAEEFVLRSYYC
jgi:hypothetical protein